MLLYVSALHSFLCINNIPLHGYTHTHTHTTLFIHLSVDELVVFPPFD